MATWNNLTDYLKDLGSTIKYQRGISGSLNAQNFAAEVAKIGVPIYLSDLVITPSTVSQTFYPNPMSSSGQYFAWSKVTVEGLPLVQSFNVYPSTSIQYFDIPDGYVGYDSFTINTLPSTVDPDIQPSNIKSGIDILGVTGTYSPTSGILEITQQSYSQMLLPEDYGYGSFNQITVHPIDRSAFNIIGSNIKKGVSILGVSGTCQPTLEYEYLTITPQSPSIAGPYSINFATSSRDGISGCRILVPRTMITISPSSATRNYGFDQDFVGFSNIYLNAINSSFPDFVSSNIKKGVTLFGVTGTYGHDAATLGNWLDGSLPSIIQDNTTSLRSSVFYNCSTIQQASFPECLSIGSDAFKNCSSLEVLSLNKCTFIATGNGGYGFYGCSNLSQIYLDKVSQVPTVENFNLNLWLYHTKISIYYDGIGSIYVPRSLYSNFLTASAWSQYSAVLVSK